MLITLLLACTLFIAVYSFHDWFRALCFALPFLAFLERPEVPREIWGIPGLNLFNVLFLFIIIGWLTQKSKENLSWIVPPKVNRLFLIYLSIFFIAAIRLIADTDSVADFYISRGSNPPSFRALLLSNVVNPLKWLIPGLLLCHGSNTDERRRFATIFILLTCVLLAAQITSRMIPALIGNDDLADRALRVLDRNIGYHRVDLAALMGSAAWGFIAYKVSTKKFIHTVVAIFGFLLCSFSMALTGGRAGYVAWAVCGIVFLALRWKKALLVAPLILSLSIGLIPGLNDRIFEGFSEESHSSYAEKSQGSIDTIDSSGRDLYSITSGRVILWPLVIEKIVESPWVGYGMQGFRVNQINKLVLEKVGVPFDVGHSHNAYLDLLLDNGFFAALLVLLFYGVLILKSMAIFSSEKEPPTKQMLAGMLLAFVVVQLVASLGSQSFYPFQGSTLMWCTIGLLMRELGNTNNHDSSDNTNSK